MTWDPGLLKERLDARTSRGRHIEAVAVAGHNPNTGTKPFLLACDDHRQYWSKWPDNPHGQFSMANEWLISTLGPLIEAPLPAGALILVEDELVRQWRYDGAAVPGGLWFGSELVRGTDTDHIGPTRSPVTRKRVARYLALWHLCFGCDEQFVYEASSKQPYSIDHGLWFDSGEGDWDPNITARVAEAWVPAEGIDYGATSPRELHAAAQAVLDLTMTDVADSFGSLPLEWGLPDEQVLQLASFVYQRREPVADHLRVMAARWKGGRK